MDGFRLLLPQSIGFIKVIIFSVHKEEYEGMLVSKSKLEIKEKNLPKRKKKSTRKSKDKKVNFDSTQDLF